MIGDEGWRAYIGDTADGWMHNTVRLILGRPRHDGRTELVCGDTVRTIEAGVLMPDDAGWVIPRSAVYAITEAIQSWQGDTNHAATEVRVLREWLTEERRRVDAFLERADD